jgi:hypothetical protein
VLFIVRIDATKALVRRLGKDDLNEMKLSAEHVTAVLQAVATAHAKDGALATPATPPPVAGPTAATTSASAVGTAAAVAPATAETAPPRRQMRPPCDQ